MTLARTLLPLATAGLLAATATPAHAQAREWLPIEGHDQLVLATCSDGSQILSSMGMDPRRNRYSLEFRVDDEGNPTEMVLMLKYAGGATHSTTGQTVVGSGADRIVVDLLTGDQTSTGGRWTVNLAGEGWVIKDAGRVTYDAVSGEVDIAGIASADWGRLCPFFGVPA